MNNKSIKQEPVAWMLTLPDGTHDWVLDGNGCEGYIPLYTHPKELSDEDLLESLAELEHRQWLAWANNILSTEQISEKRKERWVTCMIPYNELSEEMKEHDRDWARQVLAILRKASE